MALPRPQRDRVAPGNGSLPPINRRLDAFMPPGLNTGHGLPPIRLPGYPRVPRLTPDGVYGNIPSPTSSALPQLINPKVYPKTPTAQSTDAIGMIVQRCFGHKPFRTVEVRSNEIQAKSTEAETPFSQDLRSLLRMLTSKATRMSVTNGEYRNLMHMICTYIFRPQHISVVANSFAERAAVFDITNWSDLELIHAILHAVFLEPTVITTLIDHRFVILLVNALDTPVTQEQRTIENELIVVMGVLHEHTKLYMKTLVTRLVEYIEGERTSYCIGAVLRILQRFFEKSNDIPRLDVYYRRYIVPLYYTNHLSDFEKPIRAITCFFVKRNSANAEYCLRVLLRHWPATCPAKEIAFLQQLPLLVENVPEDRLTSVCAKVLRMMGKSIQSTHASVALSACFLLMDGQFLCSFGTVRKLFLVELIPALRKARGHWKGDLKTMAGELLETLGDDGTIAEREDKSAVIAQRWRQIEQMAGA